MNVLATGVPETRVPAPPSWVGDVLAFAPQVLTPAPRGALTARLVASRQATLLRLALRDADQLPASGLEDGTVALHAWLGELLAERGEVPLRFWNFVPGIRRPEANGFRRYEVFNAGRYRGLRRFRLGGPLGSRLVAASAVGSTGADLVVLVLAAKRPGHPVENPRQCPSFLYSDRYGPLPPCFSRAIVLDEPLTSEAGTIRGIVSGTASIVGEDSRHGGDFCAQAEETLRNLAAIAAAAVGVSGESGAPGASVASAASGQALDGYRHLRVYLPSDVHPGTALRRLRALLPSQARLEWTRADLCRPELLIEIEGTLA